MYAELAYWEEIIESRGEFIKIKNFEYHLSKTLSSANFIECIKQIVEKLAAVVAVVLVVEVVRVVLVLT